MSSVTSVSSGISVSSVSSVSSGGFVRPVSSTRGVCSTLARALFWTLLDMLSDLCFGVLRRLLGVRLSSALDVLSGVLLHRSFFAHFSWALFRFCSSVFCSELRLSLGHFRPFARVLRVCVSSSFLSFSACPRRAQSHACLLHVPSGMRLNTLASFCFFFGVEVGGLQHV